MPTKRPGESRILVVDDDETFRDSISLQLRRFGYACSVVASYEEAAKLFRSEAAIDIVILDHPTLGSEPGELVESLRGIRPGVTVVGNSGTDRRKDFAAAGVKRFLYKPWRVEELTAMLEGRLNACVECGLPLPLRRPLPDEPADHWACAFCGSRYTGLLDEDASPEARGNARRAE